MKHLSSDLEQENKKVKRNPLKENLNYSIVLAMMAVLGILMVIFLFSFLLSIFRAKYQGYPYRSDDFYQIYSNY
jgi:hypothetical protein